MVKVRDNVIEVSAHDIFLRDEQTSETDERPRNSVWDRRIRANGVNVNADSSPAVGMDSRAWGLTRFSTLFQHHFGGLNHG
jgi:hypothetical protein